MSDFTGKPQNFDEFAELSGSINRRPDAVDQPDRR
jgi:hypothetical protein